MMALGGHGLILVAIPCMRERCSDGCEDLSDGETRSVVLFKSKEVGPDDQCESHTFQETCKEGRLSFDLTGKDPDEYPHKSCYKQCSVGCGRVARQSNQCVEACNVEECHFHDGLCTIDLAEDFAKAKFATAASVISSVKISGHLRIEGIFAAQKWKES